MATATVRTIVEGIGTTLTTSDSVTNEAIEDMVIDVPASTTDKEIAVEWVNTRLSLLVLLSTVAMTIESNSAGAPANTLVLAANVPYVFRKDKPGDVNAFAAADVTKLFATNATLSAGSLTVKVLKDVTP